MHHRASRGSGADISALQERRATVEISPSERIAQLENIKANLLAQRGVLQSKIDQLATKSDGTTQEVLKPPR